MTSASICALAMSLLAACTPPAVPGLDVAGRTAGKQTYGLAMDVGSTRSPVGRPLAYNLSYRDLPPGAVVYVSLVRDVADRLRTQYLGDVGATVMDGLKAPAFRGRLAWDGRHVTCAPTDILQWCDTIVPGRYRLVAAIVSRAAPLSGLLPDRPDPNPPRTLGLVYSAPFVLTGPRPLSIYDRFLRYAALEQVGKTTGIDTRGPQPPLLGPGRFYAKGSRPCAAYLFLPPLSGELTVCAAAGTLTQAGMVDPSHTGPIEVTGVTRFRSGMSFGQARDVAFRLADVPYTARAPLHADPQVASGALSARGTYRSHRVQNWVYRDATWMLEIEEMEGGGANNDNFGDVVTVRVGDNGQGCVLDTRPYKALRAPAFAKAWPTCPGK